MSSEIPIVDFSPFNICENFDETKPEMHKLAQEIYDAFTSVGFTYIKNHGIPESEISKLFHVAEKFFKQPNKEKQRFERQTVTSTFHGWLAAGRELVDPSKPFDFKEAYDITEPYNNSLSWPDRDCSDFKETVERFFQSSEQLTHRILDLVCVGLKINDRRLFRKCHKKMGTPENKTTLRLLYYPVVKNLREGQLRLGEHTDYGTITLLFQDQVGGLEVLSKKKEFTPARPIEGTILVNIGDLLQRWTNDKLVSTCHRVVVPKEELFHLKPRQSVAFFVRPDNGVMIECLDGSNHYPPITALEYTKQRFNATYDLKN